MDAHGPTLILGSLLFSVGCGDTAGPALERVVVVTESLPRAEPNVAYDVTLEATGGDLSYTWDLASGWGPLPTGLSLTSDGVITGTPTAMGIFDFAVAVASGDGQAAQRTLSLAVAPTLEPDELCSEYPDYAIATFADPQLEALVRPQVEFYLGVSEDADLTCGRLSQVPSIGNGAGWNITSLLGAQNLTALRSLSLNNGSSITDLSPLSGLTGLTELNLGANSITDISPLSSLANLTELYLSDNPVSDISALSGLTSLEVLWVGRGAYRFGQKFGIPEVRGDPITDISALSGLTSLTDLWLPGHEITDLDPLSALTGLTRLNVFNNLITDISGLSGLVSLLSLTLDQNVIIDLSPLAGLTNLLGIGLRSNSITDIGPLAGLVQLSSLYLDHNSISDLSPLTGLTELRELYLDRNPDLSDIQPLLDNPGLGPPIVQAPADPPILYDYVDLRSTSVTCTDVATLEAKEAIVFSDCP